MKEATDHHITDEMRKMEEQVLVDAHKAQKDSMKNRGAKHHQNNNESEIAQMKMRAAQGCPHAAKYLKDLEKEKIEKRKDAVFYRRDQTSVQNLTP